MIQFELQTLGLLFLFAIIGGIVANKIKQPIVLGLLLVGTIIGPFGLNLINSSETIDLVIEFGTILLLFVIGMEFSIDQMMKVGFKGLIISVLKIAISFFAGYIAGITLGLGITVGVFLGVIISFSSTVVVVKVLEEKEMIDRKEMPLLLSVLILEDIFAVILLTFFTGLGSAGTSLYFTLEHLFFGMLALVVIFIVVNKYAEKVVLWVIKNNSGDEVITFLSLGICVAFAYIANVLGLSTAAGAFLAGSIVSSFKDSKSFIKSVHPYMQIFSALFFIAIGTLINISSIIANWQIILIILGIVIITRFVSVGISTFIFANFHSEGMFFSTLAMFSVGEFSLIIAKQAENFNVGIDLVSISAAIIFLTAIFMSVALKYNSQLYDIFYGQKQYNFFRKLGNVSSYLRTMFDELDTENSNTHRMKRTFYKIMGLFISIILVFVLSNRLVIFLSTILVSSWQNYLVFFVMAILIQVLIFFIYKNSKEMNHDLVYILTNIDYHGNKDRTKSILLNLILFIVYLCVGCMLPLLFFLFNLSPSFTAFPVVLIAMSGWHFIKLFYVLMSRQRSKY